MEPQVDPVAIPVLHHFIVRSNRYALSFHVHSDYVSRALLLFSIEMMVYLWTSTAVNGIYAEIPPLDLYEALTYQVVCMVLSMSLGRSIHAIRTLDDQGQCQEPILPVSQPPGSVNEKM